MTKEENAGAVLERLILSLLDEPRKAEVVPTRLPQRVNVVVRTDVNDFGKVAGKKGAHVRALRHVARMIGDRLGEVWTLAQDPNPTGGDRVWNQTDRTPPGRGEHSPTADAHLLAEILGAATGQTYAVNVAAGDMAATWAFTVTPRDWAAHEALVDKGGPEGEALVASLGTLFRAVGRRQGVGYVVEVGK